MGNLLATIALVLLMIWGIGFFEFNVGGAIHILLLIAVVSVIIRNVRKKKSI